MAPIISLYTTNLLSLTFFDVFLMALTITLLFRARYLIINKTFIAFATMIFIQHSLTVIVGDIDIRSTTMRMLRYLFYVLFLSMYSTSVFDCQYGEKTYRVIAVFASLFLLFQQAVYSMFGRYIPGFFTFLPLDREELLWHATNYENRFAQDPRPRSIFSEPQIFASFVLGYISILLFKENLNKKDKAILFIVSVAVLLSRSTTAIICLVFLWGVFFYKKILKRRVNPTFLLTLLIIIAALVFVAPKLYSSRLALGSHSVTGRMESYLTLLRGGNLLTSSLIGHGMIDIDTSTRTSYTGFIPSLLRFYKYYGFFGAAIVSIVFIRLNMEVHPRYKMLLYLIILLMVGTVDFFGPMIFVSMPFILTSRDKCEREFTNL